MNVKEHYDQHLGNFYSWFSGDFSAKEQAFQSLLSTNGILPRQSKVALDLGAGHGIQSVAMAKLGFAVKAIDFNQQLLMELANNGAQLPISVVEDDITQVRNYATLNPELIICCGDTLLHLADKQQVQQFIKDCAASLQDEGHLLFSFRNYSQALTGDQRFIPVKSDDDKILTCILDYEPARIRVTDLLQEKVNGVWNQKVSSYHKVRMLPDEIVAIMEATGLKIVLNEPINRLETIIAKK